MNDIPSKQMAQAFFNSFRAPNGLIDFYKFLGVSRDAGHGAILDAMSDQMIDTGDAKMDLLRAVICEEAAKNLISPEKRAAYDALLFQEKRNNLYASIIIDTVIFLLAPICFHRILHSIDFIDREMFNCLTAALTSSYLAYAVAFAFDGRYTRRGFFQRLRVMQSPLFIVSLYWVFLGAMEIADGRGSGNVIAWLFGFTIAFALAWRGTKCLQPQ